MTKKRISLTLDETLINELEKIKKETGLSLSQQIEIKLKGYTITNDQIETYKVNFYDIMQEEDNIKELTKEEIQKRICDHIMVYKRCLDIWTNQTELVLGITEDE